MALTSTAQQFREAALEIRDANRQMYLIARRNMRVATADAEAAVKTSALNILPRKGGLNQRVADAVVKTSILTGPRTAGVRITASRTGSDLVAINAGEARHPLYGDRDHWYVTEVEPGFFTRPLVAMTVQVSAAMLATMQETALLAGFR